MAATSIEWATDVWNPTVGCTRISSGCKNCYAFALHDMRHAAYKAGKKLPGQYAKPFGELQLMTDRLTDPLHWRKPRRVFVNSVSDLFHKDVPVEFIRQVFQVMGEANWHTFMVLTKRAERMRDVLIGFAAEKDFATLTGTTGLFPFPNVLCGVSVEDQQRADERIPLLLQTPAAVRFLSCEPLLGPLEFSNVGGRSDCVKQLGRPALAGIGWVIVGGESGPGCRPCRPEWVRSVIRQCKAVEVPVFCKQMGGNIVTRNDMITDGFNDANGWPDPDVEHDIHGFREEYQGADCRIRLRDKKGGTPDEWPTDLQVRQFPAAAGRGA